MTALTSCATFHKKDKVEYKIIYIPSVYIPTPPYPDDQDLLPLGSDLELLTEDDAEVYYIAVKKAYFKKILNYMSDTEKAAQIIEAVKN